MGYSKRLCPSKSSEYSLFIVQAYNQFFPKKLETMKNTLVYLLLALFTVNVCAASKITLTGQLVDATGQALSDVSISVASNTA